MEKRTLEERLLKQALDRKADNKHRQIPLTWTQFLILLQRYQQGNAKVRNTIMELLYCYNRIPNATQYWVNFYYGYWGCEELRPMYDNDPGDLKNKVAQAVFEGFATTLLSLTPQKVHAAMSNTYDSANNSAIDFFTACSACNIKHAIENLLVEEANQYFGVDLTFHYYKQLVKTKKAGFTGYILQYTDEELSTVISLKAVSVLKNAWWPIYGEKLHVRKPDYIYEDDYQYLYKDQSELFYFVEQVIAAWPVVEEREFFHDWAITGEIVPTHDVNRKLFLRQRKALKKALETQQIPVMKAPKKRKKSAVPMKKNKRYTALHWMILNCDKYPSRNAAINACAEQCQMSTATSYTAYKMFVAL